MIIKTLIFNTLLKEYRNKSLIVTILITILVLYSNYKLFHYIDADANLALPLNMLKLTASSISFNLVAFWGILLTMIIASNAIKSDLSLPILPHILSCPLSPLHYIMGRIGGIIVIIFCYTLISFTALYSFSPNMLQIDALFRLMLSFLLLIPALSLISFLSSLLVPTLWNLPLSLLIFGAVTFCNYSWQWPDAYTNWSLPYLFQSFFYFIFPHLGVLQKVIFNYQQFELSLPNFFFEALHYFFSLALLFFILRWKLLRDNQKILS